MTARSVPIDQSDAVPVFASVGNDVSDDDVVGSERSPARESSTLTLRSGATLAFAGFRLSAGRAGVLDEIRPVANALQVLG